MLSSLTFAMGWGYKALSEAPSELYARLLHAFLGLLYFSALLVWWDAFFVKSAQF